jgi:hypothetical protein
MQLSKKQKYNIIKKICPNSVQCITFGTQSNEIRKLFDEFKIPSKLINESEIKQIGESSNNGIIYRLKYQLKDYYANTIVKNANSYDADNLFYEAIVGWYINFKIQYFPCFVETYDLYKNENIMDPNTNTFDNFKIDLLQPLFDEENSEIDGNKIPLEEEYFYSKITEAHKLVKSCKESDKISLNIQYLENVDSLFDTLLRDIQTRKQKIRYDIFAYLYQVYAPLSMLSNEFTHYDLHSGNVLIYKISPDKYTKMIYYYPDGSKIEFNTIGVSKIIDYGRCYFKYNNNIHSAQFIETLEKQLEEYNQSTTKSSEDLSSFNCGYNSFTRNFKDYYIDSKMRNKSHDLRLVSNINDIYKHFTKQKLFNVGYKTEYGTPEISSYNYKTRGDIINNVDEMHQELKEIIMLDNIQKVSKEMETTHILHGTIECWLDGSRHMVFTPGTISIPEKNRSVNISKDLDQDIQIPKSLRNLTVTPYSNDSSSLRKRAKSLGGKRKAKKNKTRKIKKYNYTL